MPILTDPALYYGPSQEDWALGDIVIAPVAVLWEGTERPIDPYPQPAPQLDGSSSVVYQLWPGLEHHSHTLVESWRTPAVIVVDDCVIYKEYNAYITRRVREGVPEDSAEAEARADTSLDRLIPIAPMLPYSRLRNTAHDAVRQAQALGYFPVIESNNPPMDEGYVDFTRTVAVSRRLLRGPYASLSDPARRILRWKLAQFYAFRNQSVDDEITAAVGRTITDVHAVTDSKNRLVVELELDNGASSLRLRQEPRTTAEHAGHQRGRS